MKVRDNPFSSVGMIAACLFFFVAIDSFVGFGLTEAVAEIIPSIDDVIGGFLVFGLPLLSLSSSLVAVARKEPWRVRALGLGVLALLVLLLMFVVLLSWTGIK